MSIVKWMGKHHMIYTNSGILFSLRKEGNSGTFYNVDESWQEYDNVSDISQPQKGQTLYDSSYMRTLG